MNLKETSGISHICEIAALFVEYVESAVLHAGESE